MPGSKKSETASESRPAAAPWSGSSLSGCRKRAADKPEPLWRPVCEEDEVEARPTTSEDIKPSVSKPSQGDASPPSPRTLSAIRAAMNDSSDEEKADPDEKNGGVSPRTLLAIQQALTEEEDGTAEGLNKTSSSVSRLQVNIRPETHVVISSSDEEEKEEKSDLNNSSAGRRLHVKDRLFVSSSEDELEEVIGQRDKAEAEEETEKGQSVGNLRTGSRGQTEKEDELERGEPQNHQNTSSINLSPGLCGKPLHTEAEVHPVLLERESNKITDAPEETNGDDVKSESSGESESEGTV